MKITAIGCGGAFAPMSIGNSNFLFEEDGKFMAFDFGSTAPYILKEEMGFDLGDLDALYLTHEHSDHIGGVEHLAFYRYFIPTKLGKTIRPKLYTHSNLIQNLWDYSLKGGLDGHHGRTMNLTDYFECFPIRKNKNFTWQGVEFTPFQTVHVNAGMNIKHSYGLSIYNPKTGITTMITGDTCFCPDPLNHLYEKSNIILHDCETSEHRSRVHANIADLKTLSPEVKKKMYLYHHSQVLPDCGDFAGFVKKFQEFQV